MTRILILLFFSLNLFQVSAQIWETSKDIQPILIGEALPNTEVVTPEGKTINTNSIFSKKKTVLIIYRGGWCPYCSRHLAEMSKIETDLIAKGYQIVAISPDSPAKLKEGISGEKYSYRLFSDSKGNFSKALGIAYKAPSTYQKITRESQDGENLFLPVPSLFIIHEEGDILFEYINPNFKYRISSDLILAIVEELNRTIKKP